MKRAIAALAALGLAAAPAMANSPSASKLSLSGAKTARAATPTGKKNGVLGAAAPVFVGLLFLGVIIGVASSTGDDGPDSP